MCGIAGFLHPDGLERAEAAALLRRMLGPLSHRGPDGEGHWLAPGTRPWGGLGTRRLALVDPEGGHQPRTDESGRFVLSMNGEVYNHRRIAQELRAEGVALRGHSDTEAWVQLIGKLGIDPAIDRAEGMFAAAIADIEGKEITLVRDRMGKKPLYLAGRADGLWVWASEPRAVLDVPGIDSRPDTEGLRRLLLWEYIPGSGTAWQGIEKVDAGTAIRLRAGQRRRYWQLPHPAGGGAGDARRWARSVRASLEVAVARRMDADAACALVLSGGLDSSAVAAIACRRRPGLDAFHVQVNAPGFDESAAAQEAATAVGARLHILRLDIDDMTHLFSEIVNHMDEPLADSSLISTWRLMHGVRTAGYRCVLSGDGADELFGGYPTVQAHRLAPVMAPFAPVFARAAAKLPTSFDGLSLDFKLRAFADGLGQPWARRHQRWMGAWAPDEVGATAATFAPIDALAATAPQGGAERALWLDQQLYLRDGVLVKVDRMSMAHSVEVRSPFLDANMVGLAADIGLLHKISGATGKVVLRSAVADLLPQRTRMQAKRGFGSPVGLWLRGAGAPLLRDLPDRIADLVDPNHTRAVIAAHLSGARDHRRRLFSALCLSAWRGRWG